MSQRVIKPSKKQLVAAFRQREILVAAYAVFAERGFEAASMEDIARRAGVAKGTLYLYYPSKEAIYRATLREGLAELMELLRERVAAAKTVREKLRAFIETKLSFAESHREFLRICDEAVGKTLRPLHMQKDFAGLYAQQLKLLEAALHVPRGSRGVGGLPPATAATAIFDVLNGLIKRRLFGRSRRATEQDMLLLQELLWKGLAAR
jgi:AcrR family transcriptional regulator